MESQPLPEIMATQLLQANFYSSFMEQGAQGPSTSLDLLTTSEFDQLHVLGNHCMMAGLADTIPPEMDDGKFLHIIPFIPNLRHHKTLLQSPPNREVSIQCKLQFTPLIQINK